MSTDRFDPAAVIVGALFGPHVSDQQVRSITFSNENDPATWDILKLDGLQFIDHANAKKAEELFNRLSSDRDELVRHLNY